MHLKRSLCAIAVAVLFMTGCGNDSSKNEVEAIPGGANTTAYCQQLAKMPATLQEAARNAGSGAASSGDKKIIADTATQLRNAAAVTGIPADFKQTLTHSATLLDDLSRGKALSQSDVVTYNTTFNNLGKAVSTACAK